MTQLLLLGDVLAHWLPGPHQLSRHRERQSSRNLHPDCLKSVRHCFTRSQSSRSGQAPHEPLSPLTPRPSCLGDNRPIVPRSVSTLRTVLLHLVRSPSLGHRSSRHRRLQGGWLQRVNNRKIGSDWNFRQGGKQSISWDEITPWKGNLGLALDTNGASRTVLCRL